MLSQTITASAGWPSCSSAEVGAAFATWYQIVHGVVVYIVVAVGSVAGGWQS